MVVFDESRVVYRLNSIVKNTNHPRKRLFVEQNAKVTKETQLPMVLVSSQRGKMDESGEVGGASADTGYIQRK